MAVDRAGNTLARARNLDSLDARNASFRDIVGSRDRDDLYRFKLSSNNTLNLATTGSAKATVQLFTLKGDPNKILRRFGKTSFSDLSAKALRQIITPLSKFKAGQAVTATLGAGEYYVRISQRNGQSNYSVTLDAAAVPPVVIDPPIPPVIIDPPPPVPPVDAAGNSVSTARYINSLSGTSSYTDAVGSSDTNDYYSFDLGVTREFGLSIDNLTADANVDLLDINGTVIQSSANLGTSSETINRRLDTGSYYIRVYPGTSANTSYNLNLSATLPQPAPGNLAYQQTIQTIGTVNGELSTTDVLNAQRQGSYADDYALDGVIAGQAIQVNLNASFDTYLQLINAGTGDVVAFNDDANGSLNSELTFTAEAATNYLVRATSYGAAATGTYVLTTAPGAQTIGSFGQRDGVLEATDPINPLRADRRYDDYRLTGATAGQQLRINLDSTDFDAYVQLVNGTTGAVIAENDDAVSGNNNASLAFTVESGVNYFVRVTSFGVGSTGAYRLTTAPNLPTISGNQSVTGDLAVSDSNNSLRSGSYGDDYLLTGVTNGQTVQVNLNASFDTYLQLVNYDTGALITFNDDANGTINSELTFTADSTIRYAIRASSYSSGVTGSYGLTTTASAPVLTIGNNETLSGDLSTTDPDNTQRSGRFFDDYRLTGATVGQSVRINLGAQGFDTYLQVINEATGAVVAENDDANGTLNSEVVLAVGSGINYLMRVTSFGAGSVGSYTLTTTTGNNWINDNIDDAGLETVVNSLSLDGSLSRNDMIAIFRNAGSDDGIVDATEQTDLRTLVTNAPRFNLSDDVRYLSAQVANGISTNLSAASLEANLIGRHFLGTVTPSNSFNNATFSHTAVQGTLYGASGAANINDIDQGGLGDCAFLAALGAVLNSIPAQVANLLIDNGDNTYTMRFYPATNGDNGTTTPANQAEYVTVDRRLATNNSGRLLFASTGSFANSASNILWAPLVERAYAQWREFREGTNGYNLIGNGDLPQRPLSYLTGRSADDRNTTSVSFADIQSALAANRPITAWSYSDSTFIVGGHAYSVISTFTSSSGQPTVRLRNPWGVDGRALVGDNDGFVDLPFAQLAQALPRINFVAPA